MHTLEYDLTVFYKFVLNMMFELLTKMATILSFSTYENLSLNYVWTLEFVWKYVKVSCSPPWIWSFNKCLISCLVITLFICFVSAVTLPRYMPQSYQSLNQNIGRVKCHPTICISRATRTLQGNASLDREITDPKELQMLDEFLGNKVRCH